VRKAWIIAKHEFLVTVKRAWFVVATFVLPLAFGAIGGGMALVARHAVEESTASVRDKPLGVVDKWGGLLKKPGFQLFDQEKDAREELLAKKIGAYIVVPGDYLENGTVQVMTMRRPTLLTADHPPLPPGVKEWILESVLHDVDPVRIARAKAPFKPAMVFLDDSGNPSTENAEETARRSIVAYAFFLLLFTSIFTSSAYLLQGMAEEKENRVMEMVLSSVTPGELMVGKLIGLGAAGLLQMAIWVSLGLAGAIMFAYQLAVAPMTFLFCLVYFLLGYVLYGSLMLGFGALGTNLRESQQMASIWSFLGASPAIVLVAFLESPQGTVARVFSYIPFTAPTTMMFRYALDPKGTLFYDIVASMLILAVSTWFAIRLSARLYRAGLLLYGKRPGLREIWRWLVAGK
jgi:ABC-2 type transport system permease protein